MSKFRLISFIIVLAIVAFSIKVVVELRQDFLSINSRMSKESVDGYVQYYEKWEEKRLEGAKTFIKMAYEPELALTYIDGLIVLCIFLTTIIVGQTIFYEYRLSKLLNK